MTREQIFLATEKAFALGVKKFGLHAMIISNCLDDNEIFENVKMLFDLVAEIYVRSLGHLQHFLAKLPLITTSHILHSRHEQELI